MKILLLNPPPLFPDGSPVAIQIHHPPLGLLNLAAVLEKAGYEVVLCDAAIEKMNFEQVREELHKGFDIIGITTLTATRESAYLCAYIAREENEEAIVILGGHHISHLAEIALQRLPFVDIVVRGEGEITFLELVQKIASGDDYREIKGISFRDRNGVPRSNPDREVVKDLDSLPFPAWHLAPMKKYFDVFAEKEFSIQKPCTVIMTSRGCPGNCTFCANRAMWGRAVRRRSPENVLKEIEYLHHEYGVKDIHFLDDTFTFNKKWGKTFSDGLIKSGMGITWRCQGRVDTVNRDTLQSMRKSGCYFICFGVESASQRMQKSMKKGINTGQATEAIRLASKAGIIVGADFIIGLPGEEPEDREETFQFIRKSPLNSFTLNLPWIFPGTDLYRTALKEGKVSEATWFEPSPTNEGFDVQLIRPFYVCDSFASEEEALRLLRQKTSELITFRYLIRRIKLERHRWLSPSHILRHGPRTILTVMKIVLKKIRWGFTTKS